jgi:hypothetical protein
VSIVIVGKIVICHGIQVLTALWIIVQDTVAVVEEWAFQSTTLSVLFTELRCHIDYTISHLLLLVAVYVSIIQQIGTRVKKKPYTP